MSARTSRPFTLGELMRHDLKQAALQAWKAVTDPWPHYDHWRSAGRHLRSCAVRPYYEWKHRRETQP